VNINLKLNMEKFGAQEIDLEIFTDFPVGTRILGEIVVQGKLYDVELTLGVDSKPQTAISHLNNLKSINTLISFAGIKMILPPSKANSSLRTHQFELVHASENQNIPKAVKFEEVPDLPSVETVTVDERPKSWLRRVLGK